MKARDEETGEAMSEGLLRDESITTFFAGEHEVRVLDPSRVELLAAIGCEVNHEG